MNIQGDLVTVHTVTSYRMTVKYHCWRDRFKKNARETSSCRVQSRAFPYLRVSLVTYRPSFVFSFDLLVLIMARLIPIYDLLSMIITY